MLSVKLCDFFKNGTLIKVFTLINMEDYSMNMYLFKLINGLAYKNIALDKIMIIFSKYIPIVIYGNISWGLFLRSNKERYKA